jgi:hypothetical protein
LEDALIPRALADRVKGTIEVNAMVATFRGVYFNPAFTNKLKEKVPELEEAGIVLQMTSVQADTGQIVEAAVRASNGVTLSLGSVTLDGKDVTPATELATVDALISFVESNAKQTLY